MMIVLSRIRRSEEGPDNGLTHEMEIKSVE